jgi:hypothetical protein
MRNQMFSVFLAHQTFSFKIKHKPPDQYNYREKHDVWSEYMDDVVYGKESWKFNPFSVFIFC